MRIREGDPLEIYTDSDGKVIFKKYSPIGELGTFSHQYADVLFKIAGNPIAVCDRDHVIAVSGMSKKEILERSISPELAKIMDERINYKFVGEKKLYPIDGLEQPAVLAFPVLACGDVCGAVLMMESENYETDIKCDEKLIHAAAMFLGKQMEE